MIFDRPTTRIVPTTLLAVSIGFGGGYLLGYGIQTAAGEAGAHWVGLAAGGFCAALAGTVTISLVLVAEIWYWKFKAKPEPMPPPIPELPADRQRVTYEADANVTQTFYLTATTKQIKALTDGLASGRSLAGRRWYGGSDAPFKQMQFLLVRREMLKQRLAEHMNNSYAVSDLGVDALTRGYVSPLYASDQMPETVKLTKRFVQINRGKRGRGLGAR